MHEQYFIMNLKDLKRVTMSINYENIVIDFEIQKLNK